MSIILRYNMRKNASFKPTMYRIKESKVISVPNGSKSMDVFLVGGGACGLPNVLIKQRYILGNSNYYYPEYGLGCNGGCGGYCNTIKNIDVEPGKALDIHIGNGGKNIIVGANDNNNPFINSGYGGIHNSNGDQIYSFGIGRNYYKLIGVLGRGEDTYINCDNKVIAFAKGGGGYPVSKQNDRRVYHNGYWDAFLLGDSLGGGNYGYNARINGNSSTKINNDNNIQYGGSNQLAKILSKYTFDRKTGIPNSGAPYNGYKISSIFACFGEDAMNDARYYDKFEDYNALLDNDYYKYTYNEIMYYKQTSTRIKRTRYASMSTSGIYKNNAILYNTDNFYKYGCYFNQNTLGNFLKDTTLSNTREFGENNGTPYSAGGGSGQLLRKDDEYPTNSNGRGIGGNGGGGNGAYVYKNGNILEYIDAEDGKPNTGGGGGGGILIKNDPWLSDTIVKKAGNGGSGVVLIRFYPDSKRDQDIEWNIKDL